MNRKNSKPVIQPDDGDPRHGSLNGYANLRCRCDLCRAEASRVHLKARLAPRSLPSDDDPRHGTRNGYSYWHCRCERCVAEWHRLKIPGEIPNLSRGSS